MNPIANDFIKSIGAKNVQAYRIYVRCPDGKIRVTAEYTSAVIDDVERELRENGMVILKRESVIV